MNSVQLVKFLVLELNSKSVKNLLHVMKGRSFQKINLAKIALNTQSRKEISNIVQLMTVVIMKSYLHQEDASFVQYLTLRQMMMGNLAVLFQYVRRIKS